MEKLVAFRTDELTGWTVGVGASTDDIFAAAKEIRNENILVAVIILLVTTRCTDLQGYYFSRPLNSQDFTAYLAASMEPQQDCCASDAPNFCCASI